MRCSFIYFIKFASIESIMYTKIKSTSKIRKCIQNLYHTTKQDENMRISSNSFGEGSTLPVEYSEKGGNTRPKMRIEDVPPAAKSVALLFYDLDKGGGTWTHWVMWNIPPDSKEAKGTEGTTSSGAKGYSGPDPGIDGGVHRYVFHLFALNRTLNLQPSAGKSELESAMSGHIVEEYKLMVRFGRPKPIKRKKEKNVNWI